MKIPEDILQEYAGFVTETPDESEMYYRLALQKLVEHMQFPDMNITAKHEPRHRCDVYYY